MTERDLWRFRICFFSDNERASISKETNDDV